jgi:hypothetical protein
MDQDDMNDFQDMLEQMDETTRASLESKLRQQHDLHRQIVEYVARGLNADLSNPSEQERVEEEVEEMIEMFDDADGDNVQGVVTTGPITDLLREHHELQEDIMATLDEHNPYIDSSE